MQNELTPWGTAVNVGLSSATTMTVFNVLYVRKTRIMTGHCARVPLRNFYNGYGENVACDMTNWVVGFVANQFFREQLMASRPLTLSEQCLGGMFGGAVSGPFVGSLERLMILAHLHKGEASNRHMLHVTSAIVKEILHKEGIKGFLRGTCLTSVRESINYAALFGLEKVIYKKLTPFFRDEKQATFPAYLAAGAASGFVTTPIDLIKTLVQEKIGKRPSVPSIISKVCMSDKKFSWLDMHKLFRGAGARTLTVGCSMALFGVLNERIPQYLPEGLKK